MYCPNCGRRVPSNAKFCPECGQSLAVWGLAPSSPKAHPDADPSTVWGGQQSDRAGSPQADTAGAKKDGPPAAAAAGPRPAAQPEPEARATQTDGQDATSPDATAMTPAGPADSPAAEAPASPDIAAATTATTAPGGAPSPAPAEQDVPHATYTVVEPDAKVGRRVLSPRMIAIGVVALVVVLVAGIGIGRVLTTGGTVQESATVAGHAWRSDDGSLLELGTDGSFTWYQGTDGQQATTGSDSYYKGTYELYLGDDAQDYIDQHVDTSDDASSATLRTYLSREGTPCCLVLHVQSLTASGQRISANPWDTTAVGTCDDSASSLSLWRADSDEALTLARED